MRTHYVPQRILLSYRQGITAHKYILLYLDDSTSSIFQWIPPGINSTVTDSYAPISRKSQGFNFTLQSPNPHRLSTFNSYHSLAPSQQKSEDKAYVCGIVCMAELMLEFHSYEISARQSRQGC